MSNQTSTGSWRGFRPIGHFTPTNVIAGIVSSIAVWSAQAGALYLGTYLFTMFERPLRLRVVRGREKDVAIWLFAGWAWVWTEAWALADVMNVRDRPYWMAIWYAALPISAIFFGVVLASMFLIVTPQVVIRVWNERKERRDRVRKMDREGERDMILEEIEGRDGIVDR